MFVRDDSSLTIEIEICRSSDIAQALHVNRDRLLELGQGWESCLNTYTICNELIDRDVPIMHVFRLVMQHTRQRGMHGEMPPLIP